MGIPCRQAWHVPVPWPRVVRAARCGRLFIGRVRVVVFGNLQLQQARGAPNAPHHIVVGSAGHIVPIHGHQEVPRPQAHTLGWAAGHNAAQDARRLARNGEAKALLAPRQLHSAHPIAGPLFPTPRLVHGCSEGPAQIKAPVETAPTLSHLFLSFNQAQRVADTSQKNSGPHTKRHRGK